MQPERVDASSNGARCGYGNYRWHRSFTGRGAPKAVIAGVADRGQRFFVILEDKFIFAIVVSEYGPVSHSREGEFAS